MREGFRKIASPAERAPVASIPGGDIERALLKSRGTVRVPSAIDSAAREKLLTTDSNTEAAYFAKNLDNNARARELARNENN